jgi:hypothetical protein
MIGDYRSSFARFNAVSGLTTGIGGLTTSIAFTGLDIVSTALQLYRLSQRFAVLNGCDSSKPLPKSKMLNIYFGALGMNAITKATLKKQLFRAGTAASSGNTSVMLKLMNRIGSTLGKRLSPKEARRAVPVIGGLVGARLIILLSAKPVKK